MKSLFVIGSFLSLGFAAEWDAEFTTDMLAGENLRDLFNAWKSHHEKQYGGAEDSKFAVWSRNLERIAAENSKGLSYKLRMNQFGDLTDDEFHEIYNCMARDPKTKPITRRENPIVGDGSVDWTTKGVVTPVKNQGQCGSCWAFSTTGSMECEYAIKTGTLNSLSEQQLVDCSGSYGNYGCSGGWYYYAWNYAKDNGGLCSESAYTYTAMDGTCKASSCGTKYNPDSGYTEVTADSDSALQSAVDAGCVSVAIEADQFAFQYYSSGILTGTCGTSIDHAVLVVGYGTSGTQEYWKVKNSWGTGWGEQGYVMICRDCNANGQDGECGINMYPAYPNF